jgi:hypothetical protein
LRNEKYRFSERIIIIIIIIIIYCDVEGASLGKHPPSSGVSPCHAE